MNPQVETIVAIIVTLLGATGFWGFLQFLIEKRRSKNRAEDKALLGLLHNEIYTLCKRYIRKKQITAEEYDNLHYLSEPYFQMGGNGTAKRLIEEVEHLQITNNGGK